MSGPRNIEFEVTREDWIAVNEWLMANSPAWANANKAYRRKFLLQLIWMTPLFVGGAALAIGKAEATRGMYVEGALCGLVLIGVIAFGVFRLDATGKVKQQQLEQIRRADLADHIGRGNVMIDERGVEVRTLNKEMRLGWSAASVCDAGEYLIVQQGGTNGMLIPKRAFATPEAAADFLAESHRLWAEAQLPEPVRMARYLHDRDVYCPGCGYNLRGVQTNVCPECGRSLTMQTLQQARQPK
jgi:hypothetical protein